MVPVCTGVPSGFQPHEDTNSICQKVSVSIFRVYVMTITSACCLCIHTLRAQASYPSVGW